MNIFYLHKDARLCAQAHCDKHVVKMVLETAQILSSVHHIYGSAVTYKPTHLGHPCVKWAAESRLNYLWLQSLGEELLEEYTYRYGRRHLCGQYLRGELAFPPASMPLGEWAEPPRCMPEEYWRDSVVDSYRSYYAGAKRGIATWNKRRPMPDFLVEYFK